MKRFLEACALIHNGKPVVGVDIDGSIDFIFPRMLSVEAFEALMDSVSTGNRMTYKLHPVPAGD